jgi:hypothetical protein
VLLVRGLTCLGGRRIDAGICCELVREVRRCDLGQYVHYDSCLVAYNHKGPIRNSCMDQKVGLLVGRVE